MEFRTKREANKYLASLDASVTEAHRYLQRYVTMGRRHLIERWKGEVKQRGAHRNAEAARIRALLPTLPESV